MATAELGHRDVFGVKLGPAGVVVQVFQVRGGRVVERVELGTEEAIVGSSEGEVLEAAIQQFYELRGAPPEIHVPAEPDEREALETLAVRARRPPRAHRRAAARREARLRRPGQPQRRARLPDAVQPDADRAVRRARDAAARARAAGAAAPHRVLRHLDDSGQRDGRVDGGVRGRPHAAGGVPEVPHQGLRSSSGSRRSVAAPGPEPPSPQPTVQDDFAAMHEVVLRRYRKLLEQGGPFPDLVLIDGGKGQLSAAYAALEELGLANLVAVGIAKKEELLFTRDHDDPIALAVARSGAAADSAHSRRSASLRGHLPSPGAHDARSAIGARRCARRRARAGARRC